MADTVPTSLEELLAHAPWLRRLAATLVAGDDAAADDLVQETWLVAMRQPPRDAGSARAWLARVAHNLASNLRRSQGRRAEHEARASERDLELDPAALAGEVEAQRVLAEAVLRLEEPLRATVVLRWFRGLDSAAIGARQGVPAGTVRWRLAQALERLRADLDRRFGERATWCALFAPFLPIASPPLAPTGAAPSLAAGTLMSATTKTVAVALLAGALFVTWRIARDGERTSGAAPEGAPAPLAAAAPVEQPAPRTPEGTLADERRALGGEAPPSEPEPAECCIVGRVLDTQGRGVAGALVAARPSQRTGSLRSRLTGALPPSATSAADGAFSLAVPHARAFVLVATHAELAPCASDVVFAGERRDLVLRPPSALTVLATLDGEPCPGARVQVRCQTSGTRIELFTAEAATDAAGQARFAGLPAAEGGVEATLGTRRGERAFESDGTAASVTVELVATGTIRGTVLDALTQQPVAGARVGNNAGVAEVACDGAGRYAIEGVTLGVGFWSLQARAPGYAAGIALTRATPEQPAVTLDFALAGAVHARGRVLDRQRRPIAGAEVLFLGTVLLEPFTAETDRLLVTSDAAGVFEVEGLRPELAYRIVADAEGFATGFATCGPFLGGNPIELDELVLDAGGSIAGTVAPELAAAAPEGGWLVELALEGDDPPGLEMLAQVEAVRPDPRGAFAFPGVGPGRYRVSLLAASGRRGASAAAEEALELAPGEERLLVLRASRDAIEGQVLDPQGKAVKNCLVRLFAQAAPERELGSVATDREGRFRLHVHEAGPFRLDFGVPTLLFAPRTLAPVEAGERSLVVELEEFHSPFAIHGRVAGEGLAFDQLAITFYDAVSRERVARVAFVGADGRFTMENLLDSSYDLELLDFEGRHEAEGPKGVRPGDDEVVLRVKAR